MAFLYSTSSFQGIHDSTSDVTVNITAVEGESNNAADSVMPTCSHRILMLQKISLAVMNNM